MKKFRELTIGEKFEVYGDECLNYDYPKICVCVKEDESTGKEIGGIRFGIHPGTEVMAHEEKPFIYHDKDLGCNVLYTPLIITYRGMEK